MEKELRKLLEGQLNQREVQLLDKLNATVIDRLGRKEKSVSNGHEDEKAEQFIQQVSVAVENLKAVIRKIKDEEQSVQSFLKTFPEWKKNRKKCIQKLKKISNSLDRDRFRCNVWKLLGYSLSFAGGAAVVASGVSMPFNPDVAGPLATVAIAGGSVAAASSLAVLGLSIAEAVRLNKRVNKAKKLIKQEVYYLEYMRDWPGKSDELQEELRSVLEIDVVKDITVNMKKFFNKAIKIKKDQQRLKFIEKKVKDIISTPGLEESTVPATTVARFLITVATVILLLSKTENRLVFDFGSLTAKSVTVVAALMENSLEVFGLSSVVAVDSAAVAAGAVGAVGMVLDSVAIVKTSVDIYRGSRSPEAKKIVDATQNLEEEAASLEGVYRRYRRKLDEFPDSERKSV